MFSFGVMTAVALAVVALCAWWWMRRAPQASGQRLAAAAAALWLTSVAATWAGRAAVEPAAPESGAAIAWPVAPKSPLVTASGTPKSGASQVGSVESLVSGLEKRLEANPNDANGWALLAQSYAYTANEEAVERAFERAVALGADPTTLRERVDTAKRSAPSFDWVDRAISAPAQ